MSGLINVALAFGAVYGLAYWWDRKRGPRSIRRNRRH